jgi:hypothetical protein
MSDTVIFLGAGATKSCNGPLTNEILPNILRGISSPQGPSGPTSERDALIGDFLTTLFHVTPVSLNEQFPGLPLLMSLIDTALDRRQSFHPDWNLDRVSQLREAIEFAIFDHLEERLMKAPTNNHWNLFRRSSVGLVGPSVITTNYDLIADTAMMFVSEERTGGRGGLPDYRCQISSTFYHDEPARFGTLLKLHGSLSWLYCRTCGHLEFGASESRKYLAVLTRIVGPTVERSFSPDGALCPVCKATRLRPLLIAPTHLKNYRNPHILQVWYEAEQVLRKADRVVFIGYSLPEDDVEVIYLLKRSLSHLAAPAITVVEFDKDNPNVLAVEHAAGRRYRTLFGDAINWHAAGLDVWLGSGASGLT